MRIILKWALKNGIVERGLDLPTSGCIHVVSRCEHGNEKVNPQHLCSRKCGELF